MSVIRSLRENLPKVPSRFVDDMAFPTQRKKRFTEDERDILLTLLKRYSEIIENKRTDSITVLQKKRTWNKITEEYNRSPAISRQSTVKQLEKAWKNWKSKERDFRLANYEPKIPLNDETDSGDDEVIGPPYLLSSQYSRPVREAIMCNFGKNLIEDVVTVDNMKTDISDTFSVDTPLENDSSLNQTTVSDDSLTEDKIIFDSMVQPISSNHSLSEPMIISSDVLNDEQFHQELQKQLNEQIVHSPRQESNVGRITIASMHSDATSQSTSNNNQDCSQSFLIPISTQNDTEQILLAPKQESSLSNVGRITIASVHSEATSQSTSNKNQDCSQSFLIPISTQNDTEQILHAPKQESSLSNVRRIKIAAVHSGATSQSSSNKNQDSSQSFHIPISTHNHSEQTFHAPKQELPPANVRRIAIAAMHSGATSQSTSNNNQDSSQSIRMPISSRNHSREIEKTMDKEQELHNLKILIASAQLAKVRAEAEGQALLLKEQLRKAKAEAELAELLLRSNRTKFGNF